MAPTILVTGAAGYIGGSILASFRSTTDGPLKDARVLGVVRSQTQIEKLKDAGIEAIVLDIRKAVRVSEVLAEYQVDMVINAAIGFDPSIPPAFIEALGHRKREAGREAWFIQTSVTNLYTAESGWTYGTVTDEDDVYAKEIEMRKQGKENPVLEANLTVVEEARKHDVTSVIVSVPATYGRGSGAHRVLSVGIPAYIRAALKQRVVHKLDTDGLLEAVHISDLTDLYTLIVTKLLNHDSIPIDEMGYYFAGSHKTRTWHVMDAVASALYARGLVDQPTAQTWPSQKEAAEGWGFPEMFVRVMGGGVNDYCVCEKAKTALGWEPQRNYATMLDNMESEVEDTLTLDTVKPTIFNGLLGVGME